MPFLLDDVLARLESVYGRSRYIARFDPTEELVSCILSQHTADTNSFPTFTRLMESYEGWDEVVEGGAERLKGVIAKAGLANNKSKAIMGCLTEIKARTGGYDLRFLREMPVEEAREWLLSLPGVGPKTAAITLCFGLGRDAIPVDTHVHRVSLRLGILKEGTDANKAHDVLAASVPSGLAFRFHNTLIQHGRQTCKAPLPVCDVCVIRDECRWFRTVGPEKAREQMRRARSVKRARGAG